MPQRLPVLVVLALLAGPALATAASGPYVTFSLTLASDLAPSHRTCAVAIPEDATAIDLLDEATRQRCISSWSYSGGEVECIDGLCSGSGWMLYVDGTRRPAPLWHVHVEGGEAAEFVFADLRPLSS